MDGGVACSVQHNLSTLSPSHVTAQSNRPAAAPRPRRTAPRAARTPKHESHGLGLRCEERAPNIPRYLHM